MHRTRGGIYIVDKLTEFSIPNSKDQLYALKEVIEKVYMFKVYILFDACLFLYSPASLDFLYDSLELWITTLQYRRSPLLPKLIPV